MSIENATFQFLQDLDENNNRDWFAEQKQRFLAAQNNAKNVFATIHGNLQKHDQIETSKMMRIYRDVRFSNDKTPYKPHFANSFSRLGKELRGGYFIRIKPGASLVAGGFWEPNKEDLHRIRQEIAQDATDIKAILNDPTYQQYFGGKFECFEELKTAPRGFDKEHPELDLLRKKGFIAQRNFTDAEVLSENFIAEVDNTFKALRPFFDLFSDILTTNLNGESIL
ncbi:DUF2461 domain-containing protein [Polaribacter sp.]|uniref:DUF2461 domain-containing protein n=1 Tax=Polaribacter sp. TaxID=1920175 RepID=UPI004047E69F